MESPKRFSRVKLPLWLRPGAAVSFKMAFCQGRTPLSLKMLANWESRFLGPAAMHFSISIIHPKAVS